MTAIKPTTNTYSSRRFNQDASGAKRAAANGPVFITDRGRPAHVLMTIEEYRKLTQPKRSIADMLAMDQDVPEFDKVMEEVRAWSRTQMPRDIDFD